MPTLDADLDLYTRIRMGLVIVNKMSRPICRFWKRVNKDGPVHPVYGQCWTWTGSTNQDGYGSFGDGNRVHKVHRWAYEELVGPIPNKLQVLHRCDNPPCVRPDHFFLGTQQGNIQDMVDKDRQAKPAGETNGRSKLTEEDVRDVLRRYRRWSYHGNNALELAEEKGVDRGTIQRIVSGKNWKHIS